ncbi:hypothetical protein D3870_12815 [Noviherbaspirillum cavernae]|uniref:Virulence factor n=1 Tax=Noviherbaspirillum cavernae TaxID=2320862 RepID=A0A418X6P6_9BURK|nr:hypothetical protein D3870_12815 [Noviherbaspirillum cavernae]
MKFVAATALLSGIAPLPVAYAQPDVNWSVSIGSGQPAPYIYSPPPVVYVQPQPVYVRPQPVYVHPYYGEEVRHKKFKHHGKHHGKHHHHHGDD